MAIDILGIEPTKLSKDLRGKYVLLFAKPKAGKSSLAARFPKPLILATERGYNMLHGAYVQDIITWSDYKAVLRQLGSDAAKEKYETIVIDTVTILYGLCEKYVCQSHGVKDVGDIGWGQGYRETATEFEESLRKITQMGYGVVLIAHSAIRIEKKSDGSEIEMISPDLDKRATKICNALVDIICYLDGEFDEDGNHHRYLYTRNTPTIAAGSRYKYLDAKIPLGYQELVDAIARAIQMEIDLDGAEVTNDTPLFGEANLDYFSLMDKARDLWGTLAEKNDENGVKSILDYIEDLMGKQMRISDFSDDQVVELGKVVEKLKEIVG